MPAGWRPAPDEALLLRAALGTPGDAASAWRAWRAAVGGDAALGHPAVERLLPLVYRTVALSELPVGDREVLAGAYRATFLRNAVTTRAGARALQALHRSDVDTMVLKGAALGPLYYRDEAIRAMGDMDILVPRSAAQRAYALLCAEGWRPRRSTDFHRTLATTHSTDLVDGQGAAVDLHWEPVLPFGPGDLFWAHAVPLQIGQVATRAMGPADQLLVVLVHGTQTWGVTAQWIADSVTILRVAGARIDWELLAHRAAARGVTLRVSSALRYLRDEWAAAVPTSALAGLDATRVSPVEVLSHLAARSARLGPEAYLHHWAQWRRMLAGLPPDGRAGDFLQYLQWTFGEPSRARCLLGMADRWARRIARSGPDG